MTTTPAAPVDEDAFIAALTTWSVKALEAIRSGRILTSDQEARIVVEAYISAKAKPVVDVEAVARALTGLYWEQEVAGESAWDKEPYIDSNWKDFVDEAETAIVAITSGQVQSGSKLNVSAN